MARRLLMFLLGAAPHSTAAWSVSEPEDAILYSRWQCNADDGSVPHARPTRTRHLITNPPALLDL